MNKCIICDKELPVGGYGIVNGIQGTITGWYGSKHDLEKFNVTICDECVDKKLEKVGDEMLLC